jgi:hypothetical protein
LAARKVAGGQVYLPRCWEIYSETEVVGRGRRLRQLVVD